MRILYLSSCCWSVSAFLSLSPSLRELPSQPCERFCSVLDRNSHPRRLCELSEMAEHSLHLATITHIPQPPSKDLQPSTQFGSGSRTLSYTNTVLHLKPTVFSGCLAHTINYHSFFIEINHFLDVNTDDIWFGWLTLRFHWPMLAERAVWHAVFIWHAFQNKNPATES